MRRIERVLERTEPGREFWAGGQSVSAASGKFFVYRSLCYQSPTASAEAAMRIESLQTLSGGAVCGLHWPIQPSILLERPQGP